MIKDNKASKGATNSRPQLSSGKKLTVIGPSAYVSIGKRALNVPAKIDTGAENSAIWASHVRIDKDGILKFRLFGETSPFYNGKVYKRKDYKIIVTRSAMGQEQIRYRVHFPVEIAGCKIRVLFSLADRSNNNFPVLVGRRTISGRFYVDVSKNHTRFSPKNPKSRFVQRRFEEDPYEFHRKYIEKLGGNVENINIKQKGVDHENSDTL